MVNHRSTIPTAELAPYIRRTSDWLCRGTRLSVVQPSRDKGKSYGMGCRAWRAKSWKAKLKAAIDAVIPQAKDFDDFLHHGGAGYEIKQGKFISFRAPDRKTLHPLQDAGRENYTEEAITSRIKGLAGDRGPNRQHKGYHPADRL